MSGNLIRFYSPAVGGWRSGTWHGRASLPHVLLVNFLLLATVSCVRDNRGSNWPADGLYEKSVRSDESPSDKMCQNSGILMEELSIKRRKET